jgi:hypothetical protein
LRITGVVGPTKVASAMRRVAGLILVTLGAFLVVLAPLAKWYVAPRSAVAPLGCTGTELCDGGVSISPSTGTATQLFDAGTLSMRNNVPLTNTQRVKPDVAASEGANNRTVYESFSVVTDPSGTTIDAGTERIAFDGHTSQMLNCCNANENGTAITDFTGINPFKFPFGTEKKTYQYFDGTLAKALPMVFKDVEKVQGLEVYKFEQDIPATQYTELEVPGSLVGQPDVPAVKAPRFYSNVRTVWVEPTTGAVVKGQEVQKQYLAKADGSEGLVLIAATLSFTQQNIDVSVKTAKDGASKLNLISKTIPLVSLLLGLVLLGLGLWLALGSGGTSARPTARSAGPAPATTVKLDDVLNPEGPRSGGPPAS